MVLPRTSLKVKFLLPVVLVLSTALTTVSTMLFHYHRNAMIRSAADRARTVAANVAEQSRRAVLAGDRAELEAILAAIRTPLFRCVLIASEKGDVLALDGTPPAADVLVRGESSLPALGDRESLDLMLADVLTPIVVSERGEGGEDVLFEGPAKTTQQIVGFVRVGLDREAVFRPIDRMRPFALQIAVIALVLSGLAIVLALYLTVIRPIGALRRTTAAVTAGNLAARTPVMARDEVGDLAADFNAMIDRVQRSDEEQRRNAAEISRKNEQLFATAQLLNGILAGVSDSAIAALDLDGKIVTFNRGAETVFGCPAADVLGRDFATLIADADRRRLQEILSVAGRGLDVVEQIRGRRRNNEFSLLLTVNLRCDSAQNVIGFVVVGRDLTPEEFERELLLRNRELEQASRAKSEFLANMSHELRTPLNAVIGFAEILRDDIMGPLNEEQHRAAGSILDSGRHLLGLINEILDLSKIEAGKMQMAVEAVPLDDPIESAIAVAAPLASKKQLRLEAVLDSRQRAWVQCDPARFRQILLNLLSNAIKFTNPGGSVKVRTRIEESSVAVDVEDTGIGIAANDLMRLFQQFQQLENVHTKRHGGTGLGLALSKALAEMQGGTITVRSEPGKGSCFTLWLLRVTPVPAAIVERASTVETVS